MRDATNAILGGLVMLTVWASIPASAKAEAPVEIINASTPTRCAEEDNVYIKLQGERVRRFRIEARHPAYVGAIVADRWDPDFANCNMPAAAAYRFEPRRLTIYETEDWQLVGLTFPSFWRPNSVPVRVGTRIETGFHLLQLWTRFPGACRRSPGALSHRRLLAGASFGASELARNGVRLFLSRRTRGRAGSAPGRPERRRVRSSLAHLLAELRSRRRRDATP